MVLRILSSQIVVWKCIFQKLTRLKVVIALLLAGTILLLHATDHKIIFTRNTSSWVPDWIRQEMFCHPAKNIAFLKTHKCASSAIQNILFRYGTNHHLLFALPETGNYFGGGRMPFNADMVRATPWYMLQHNILAVHMKWDYQQVSSIMPNDTIYVTIVREPTELFESLFTYTAMDKGYSQTIDEFVATHEILNPRFKGYLGYNQMTWDFGLPIEQLNNQKAVQEMIEKSEREFHLVLLAERMDESLVLLRQLLCWDLEDVIVLKINARIDKFKKEMNATTKHLLKQRLASDYHLYNHFAKKFDQLVEAYGRNRMGRDVAMLKKGTSKLMDICGFTKIESADMQGPNKPWSNQVSGYNTKSRSSKCDQFSRSEIPFINLLRGRQKMEAIRKFGSQVRPGLDALPLGAEAVNGPDDMEERIRKLKMILVHKDPK